MKIFILGLIFGLVIQPLLDGFTSLLLSLFETIKSYFAVKISTNNQKMAKLNDDSPKHAIGFVVPGEEEYYDEEDDL